MIVKMRAILTAGLLLIGLGAVAAGASGAEAEKASGLLKPLVSGIPHAVYFGVAFDKGRGLVVGGGGSILQSSDGGVSWKQVRQSPTPLTLLSVDVHGSHAVAVGQTGVIVVEDAPGKWSTVDSGTKSRLMSVSVNTAGLAVAVGEFGVLILSQDGGRTWTSATPDWSSLIKTSVVDSSMTGAQPHLYVASVTETGEITVAGEFGVILYSVDLGKTWQSRRAADPSAPSIFAMYQVPKGAGNSFAVGQSGEILKSADGGITWEAVPSGTKSNFLGVTVNKNGEAVITGMRAMLRSTDGGANWAMVKDGDALTDWYQTVKNDEDSGRIIAVGHAGRVIQIGG